MQLINNFIVSLYATIKSARSDEKGQTLVEYALIIALMSVFLVGALQALSGGVDDVFRGILEDMGVASGS